MLDRRLASALALAAAVSACRQPATPPPERSAAIGYLDESALGPPRPGGTLFRRLEGEPATLNPLLQTDDYGSFVIADVARNLIDLDKRLQPVGGLADRWESSPDGRTWTFHLRDAAWEDGTPVTSRDALFTFEKVTDPKIPALLFSSGFDGYAGAEAVDDRTFRVHFREPYAFRIYAFNLPLVCAARNAKRDFLSSPDDRAPFSDGPYRIARWRTSESIELVRNPRYSGPRAPFDRVVFRILPDGAQAYRALERGDIDEMRLSTEQWRASATDASFASCCRTTLFYDLSYFYIGYNNKSPLFADVPTRRAMAMLLDRGRIVRDLFYGTARILSGPWAPDSPAYDPSVAPYPFDPAGARALLASAGWKDTDGDGVLERAGRKFEFDLLYGAGSASVRQVCEVFKSDLEKAGVVCRPRAVEWAAFTKRMDAGDFEAVASSWSGDPNPDVYGYWASSQGPPNGLNNLSYANPEVDRLLAEVRAEPDAGKRRSLFSRIHRLIHDDAPATFVFQGAQKYAVSRSIGGLVSTPVGLFRFWPDSTAWWRRPAP
ncbi:MAG TPA: ABC transporter substrate-binding protein [Thermoanaerobaculia bacterium]|nr:ABC transporter substrate-binding protein [Thermoanaerobaculia bacterium]